MQTLRFAGSAARSTESSSDRFNRLGQLGSHAFNDFIEQSNLVLDHFLHATTFLTGRQFSEIQPKHGVFPLTPPDPASQGVQKYQTDFAGSLYSARTKVVSLHRAPFDPAPFPDRRTLRIS